MDVTTDRVVFDDGILRISPLTKRFGLLLEGEFDRDREPALSSAISSFASTRPDPAPIDLDLTGLRFIDVGALRMLVAARDDELVHVIAASDFVWRLLRLAGWEWPASRLPPGREGA